MKNIIKWLYVIYIITFLDLILKNPVLNIYSVYSVTYATTLVILLLKTSKGIIRKTDFKPVYPILLFLILIFISAFRTLTDLVVLVKMISLLIILICNYYFFKRYNMFNEVILSTFLIPSFFLLWRFISEGAPFVVYSKLDLLFGAAWNERYRVAFGTYHPNAVGNLACCIIMISYIVLFNINMNNNHKTIRTIWVIILDFINFTILLSSDSRTSILAVAISIVVVLFFLFTKIERRIIRILSRFLLAIVGICIFLYSQSDSVVDLFVSSNRYANFTVNIPLLNTLLRKTFGLGMIDSASFGNKLTTLGDTFFVDNYFLYILLTLGITGILIIVYMVFSLFRRFYREVENNENILAILLMSIFIGHLFTAFGETCFLYYSFPSSFFYFSCYLAYFSFLKNKTD